MTTFSLAEVLRFVKLVLAAASNPLVLRMIDNMVAGTPTRVDDWVWRVVKVFLSPDAPPVEEFSARLEKIQERYDGDPVTAKTPEPTFRADVPVSPVNPADPFGLEASTREL